MGRGQDEVFSVTFFGERLENLIYMERILNVSGTIRFLFGTKLWLLIGLY